MLRLFLTIALFGMWIAARGQDVSVSTTPRIQVSTTVARVDVSVADATGQFVSGLKAENFQVFEDGVPQSIASFEEVAPVATRAMLKEPAPAGSLPSGVQFTNLHRDLIAGSDLTVILLDLLNTSEFDQFYARQQLIRFLEALPPGHTVALFILSDRLHLIQDVTGRSDDLVTAAKAVRPQDFGLVQGSPSSLGPGIFTNFASAMRGSRGGVGFLSDVTKAQGMEASAAKQVREGATLQAMEEIALAMGGYKGRKSLLWLSGNFPLLVGSQPTQARYLEQTQPGAKSVANLLSDAEIAIYPISLRGLQTGALNAEISGSMADMGSHISSGFFARQQFYTKMTDIAAETGGQAFFNTNDFAGALQKSLYQGSHYYTLTYRPTIRVADGKFRAISVKLNRRAGVLAYRHGYYALPSVHTSPEQEINAALSPGVPEATTVHLSSVIVAADPDGKVTLQSTVDPSDITFFRSADGGQHATLIVRLIAFPVDTRDGRPMKQTSGTIHVDLDANRFQIVAHEGIAFQQQLQVTPGSYHLRLGVVDLQSHRIGTLDIPFATKQKP